MNKQEELRGKAIISVGEKLKELNLWVDLPTFTETFEFLLKQLKEKEEEIEKEKKIKKLKERERKKV